MTIFLGVDGGGTKTEFICIDEQDRVVARALAGTTYHLQVGFDEAVARLAAGIGAICGQLAISPADLRYGFFGLPAFGEDATIDALLEVACGRLLGHDRYRCGNDMICGWAGSLGCSDGINLVAGTGSIGYGERRGRAARVGGWGEIFGDEGSAYWIAVQGLSAFTHMSDGRLDIGPLKTGFTRALDLQSDIDLCARVLGANGMPRDEIAALAPVVLQAADEGDAAAVAILDKAGSELARMARSLRRQLGFDDQEAVLLSWSGGILKNFAAVRASLVRNLASASYEIIEPLHEPGFGAALYAARLERAGIS